MRLQHSVCHKAVLTGKKILFYVVFTQADHLSGRYDIHVDKVVSLQMILPAMDVENRFADALPAKSSFYFKPFTSVRPVFSLL